MLDNLILILQLLLMFGWPFAIIGIAIYLHISDNKRLIEMRNKYTFKDSVELSPIDRPDFNLRIRKEEIKDYDKWFREMLLKECIDKEYILYEKKVFHYSSF